MPSVLFKDGVVLGEVVLSEEDRELTEKYLMNRCRNRVYERVGLEEVQKLVWGGKMLSSKLTV